MTNQPSKKDLEELFYKDPEDLSAQDRAAIIAALREERQDFVASEASGAKKKKQSAANKAAALGLGDFTL